MQAQLLSCIWCQVEWLREKSRDIPIRLVFESALELMGTTQLGGFKVGLPSQCPINTLPRWQRVCRMRSDTLSWGCVMLHDPFGNCGQNAPLRAASWSESSSDQTQWYFWLVQYSRGGPSLYYPQAWPFLAVFTKKHLDGLELSWQSKGHIRVCHYEKLSSREITVVAVQMDPSGKSKGPPPAVKKVLSLFGSGREEDRMVGYLSFLKIGPKLLKFLPGTVTVTAYPTSYAEQLQPRTAECQQALFTRKLHGDPTSLSGDVSSGGVAFLAVPSS